MEWRVFWVDYSNYLKVILLKELKNSKLTNENYLRCFIKLGIKNSSTIIYLCRNDLESCGIPNHLLFGRQLEYLSSYNGTITLNQEFKDMVQYSKNIEAVIRHFWWRWRREYFSELREQSTKLWAGERESRWKVEISLL